MNASPPPTLAALVRRLSEISVLRFGVVGVSNMVIGLSLFWATHHVVRASAAQSMSYGVGMLWSYYWNRRWTFKSQGNVASEAGRFFGLQIAFLFLSSAMIGLLVDHAHFHPLGSWFAVSVFITVLNFVASRYWAFKAA